MCNTDNTFHIPLSINIAIRHHDNKHHSTFLQISAKYIIHLSSCKMEYYIFPVFRVSVLMIFCNVQRKTTCKKKSCSARHIHTKNWNTVACTWSKRELPLKNDFRIFASFARMLIVQPPTCRRTIEGPSRHTFVFSWSKSACLQIEFGPKNFSVFSQFSHPWQIKNVTGQ